MLLPRKVFVVLIFSLLSGFTWAQEKVDIQRLDPNMTLAKADSEGIAWLDPRSAPFRLAGFAWLEQDHVFRRLPVNPEWEIRKPVDSLANCTAGGQIQFR
ncbi:MAG: hypothetical protein HOI66_17020, partial [Verrucomicrobia bacterium]|nr:hypothetical protein [Verrucomicrobiota bacterium]